jgi:flavin reductase (DIM6/NTAB) family NADH-FMN oxidoreductase RutF
MKFDLDKLSTVDKQYYLQHVIAPRPICFASTIDVDGNVNLSPFSFFNMVSSNPPIVIFSPSRRVRDNTTKHTLQNVAEVPEVVINLVSFDMVQQTSLASCEFAKGVDEFIKAGFTKEPATLIRPPMVRESKAKLECGVVEIKSFGNQGGAGNLVICEVLVLHINDDLLTVDRKFDQAKFELVARLGGDWYCRVTRENLFTVPKPNTMVGMGIDALPENIRNSKILTGNHLGMLANVPQIPKAEPTYSDPCLPILHQNNVQSPEDPEIKKHRYAAQLLEQNRVSDAWQVLISQR